MPAGAPGSWKKRSPTTPGFPSRRTRTFFSTPRPKRACLPPWRSWASTSPVWRTAPGMPEGAPQGTVLAFDFGEKRIGVAVGETLLGQAHPLQVIRAERSDERFAAISALLAE